MTTNADELIRRANVATKNIAARGDDKVTKTMVEHNDSLAVVMTLVAGALARRLSLCELLTVS